MDFNWQLTYDLASPKGIAKGYGNRVCCTLRQFRQQSIYIPIQPKAVHFGEQTWEEMMFGFFDVAVPMDKTAMDLMMPKRHPETGAERWILRLKARFQEINHEV